MFPEISHSSIMISFEAACVVKKNSLKTHVLFSSIIHTIISPFRSHKQKLFRLYLRRCVYRRNHLGKPPLKPISTSATAVVAIEFICNSGEISVSV